VVYTRVSQHLCKGQPKPLLPHLVIWHHMIRRCLLVLTLSFTFQNLTWLTNVSMDHL
jgi:hypothetical protein